MATYFRNPVRRLQAIGLSLVALCGAIAAFASVTFSGTKTGATLSIGLTIGPALLYAAIVSPIAFPFGLYAILTPFDTLLALPQFGTVTKLVGALTGAFLVFYIIRTKRYADPPRNVALWILLFLWMLASMFWAADTESAQKLLATSVALTGLYVISAMVPVTLKQLRIACGAVALGGMLAATYGLWLYRSGLAGQKDRLWFKTDTSSWNPDHVAGSLLLPISLCIVAVFWSKVLAVRVVAALGICIMLFAMVYTGARGAALGFAALLVYFLIRDRHRVQLAVLGGLLAAVTIILRGPAYLHRWQDAQQSGGSGRLSVWRVGWHAFQQNWLYGAGYGNFPFAYDRAFIGVFQSFYADWHRASHNIMLGYGVELGVIGLTLLLLAWWGQFRMLRDIPENSERWPYRLAMEGAIVSLFVAAMFADVMTQKYPWLAFMLTVFVYNAAPQRAVRRSSVAPAVEEAVPAHA